MKRLKDRFGRACCLLICALVLVTGHPLFAQDVESNTTEIEIPQVTPSPSEPTRRKGVRDMPRDLATNSLRLFSRSNLAPLILGAGAAAASHRADLSVREHFEQPRLGRAGDIFGARLGGGAAVAAGVGSVWLLSRVRGSEHFSQFSNDLAEASTLNGLITFGLKQSIHRKRPSGGDYSFPSGHTSTAFAIATVVDHHYGWKTSVAGYAVATFIGFSRIDSSKHYLSDVVAGATIGYITGRTVTRQAHSKGTLVWSPFVSPSSRTAGLILSW